MTYTKFVADQLSGFQVREPIFTSYIAKELSDEYGISQKEGAAATSVALKRIMDSNDLPELRFYQKGIYYFTEETPFGEVGIDKERLIEEKYILPHNGYEAGYTMLYRLGLTTQLPKERCIVSNNASDCARLDKKLGVMVKPSKTKIDEGNKAYLQFLDILDLLEKSPIELENPYTLLEKYACKMGLDYQMLLTLADKFYTKKTIMQLAHVASQGGTL
jgi:hypothetical protein